MTCLSFPSLAMSNIRSPPLGRRGKEGSLFCTGTAAGLLFLVHGQRSWPTGLRPTAYCSPPTIFPLVLQKEVIQPHLPVRLPCYDFTPLTRRTFDGGPLAVSLPASGVPGSEGVTGGVYKARERIHRAVLMRDY